MAFPTGWGRKVSIVIQSSEVEANQTNFAHFLNPDNLPTEIMDSDSANAALEGGGDIRASLDSAGINRLAVEVVAFERGPGGVGAKVEIHVKVPTVSASSNTTYYLWYKKAGESQPAIDSTYGAENVWNANYLGVWHMQQDPTGGAPQFLDSTSNDNDGTAESSDGSWVAGDVVDLEPYKGLDFNVAAANSKRLDLPASTQTLSAVDGAVTTIFKMNTDSNLSAFNKWVMGRNVGGAANGDFLWWFQNSVSDRFTLGIQDAGGSSVARSNATNFTAGTIYMAQGSWETGGDHILYVEGAPQATKATGRTLQAHAGVAFAICSEARLSVKNNETPDFIITEHRFEKVKKTDNDASTEYNGLRSPGTFAIPGTPGPAFGVWPWPGLTQPNIVYNATTVNFPVPVRCRLTSDVNINENIAIDKSIEIVDRGYPESMTVQIDATFDATFIADMLTFFKDWAGQGKWFTFTSGQNTRYDGEWLLDTTKPWRPKIIPGGGKKYVLPFKRIYN
jgi:hypothetical protein